MIDESAFYDVTLIVTNTFGTDSITYVDYIEVIPVGINDHQINEQSVSLYPNPTNGRLTVMIPAGINADITIFDMTGKPVLNRIINTQGKFNLSNLEKGIYFVKITDTVQGSVVVKRLVIK